MKRKNLVYFGILLVLAIIAIIVVVNRDQTPTRQDLKDFAVTDTAAIDKIFLADMSGNEVVLNKTNEGWMVNDEYPVNRSRFGILMETLRDVEVKHPVSKSARENVLKEMAARNVKVEIYQNGKLAKTYYVGGTTPDETGSYMMLEYSNTPYVTHRPGFVGYINTRYFAQPREWRSKEIFPYSPLRFKEVVVEYPQQPSASFRLRIINNDSFQIQPVSAGAKEIEEVNKLKVKGFLHAFQNLQPAGEVQDISGAQLDSLRNATPFARYKVQTRQGQERTLFVFEPIKDVRPIPLEEVPEDAYADRRPINYYGVVGDDPGRVILLQTHRFNRLMVPYQYFERTEEDAPPPK